MGFRRRRRSVAAQEPPKNGRIVGIGDGGEIEQHGESNRRLPFLSMGQGLGLRRRSGVNVP